MWTHWHERHEAPWDVIGTVAERGHSRKASKKEVDTRLVQSVSRRNWYWQFIREQPKTDRSEGFRVKTKMEVSETRLEEQSSMAGILNMLRLGKRAMKIWAELVPGAPFRVESQTIRLTSSNVWSLAQVDLVGESQKRKNIAGSLITRLPALCLNGSSLGQLFVASKWSFKMTNSVREARH